MNQACNCRRSGVAPSLVILLMAGSALATMYYAKSLVGHDAKGEECATDDRGDHEQVWVGRDSGKGLLYDVRVLRHLSGKRELCAQYGERPHDANQYCSAPPRRELARELLEERGITVGEVRRAGYCRERNGNQEFVHLVESSFWVEVSRVA